MIAEHRENCNCLKCQMTRTSETKPGKSQEGNKWIYTGKYNDGGIMQWYGFVNLPSGTPIKITLEEVKEE